MYSKNIVEHVEHLREVFTALRRAILYLNKKKTRLCVGKLKYLGFITTSDGTKMDSKKVAVIIAWPIPQNMTTLRSFLGFVQFYRRHIRGYSEIVAPLIELTSKKVQFVWGENR